MLFIPELFPAKLIRSYKRFLSDVKREDQHTFNISVPNTGSMLGLTTPNSNIWLSYNNNPKRKYAYQLEIIEINNTLVGINTTLSNKLALEAIQNSLLPELNEYKTILKEQRYGTQSRIDFLLRDDILPDCYLEVKNVHFIRQKGLVKFPDTEAKRGTRHLEELIKIVQQGK
ncbi:sugar fermentation stimulation protein [Bartonella koehlerae C-29]|uniref:Sugar fermentation stimulation protein n=1 Tax=Bartonella koehlerae C-29 TaxID=1134510 RepID=A0A067WE62_9HYPH|nr:sugar fermentation stimulation protein [Bartonella koehlerae C-29]